MYPSARERFSILHRSLFSKALLVAATIVLCVPMVAGASTESKPALLSPGVVSAQNGFLRADVGDADSGAGRLGRFTIGTTGGDPATSGDDHKRLLFGFASDGLSLPGTSHTTIRITTGGSTVDRDTGAETPTSLPTLVGDAIVTVWTMYGVRVEQQLSMTTNPYTGHQDMARIAYVLTNNDSQPHGVGLRVMLDTMIAGNDAAPFFVPGAGNLTTERDFLAGNMPAYWRAFESPSFDPALLKGQGILTGPGVTTPDRFALCRWPDIKETIWDYTVNSSAELGDSAVALYWNPADLAPGQSRTLATFYGLAGEGGGQTWIDGPSTLTCDQLSFSVTHWVVNNSAATWTGARTEISLPPGISLATGESATKSWPDLAPGTARSATWQLVAAPAATQSSKTISAMATFASGASPISANKSVLIPACPTPTPTNGSTPTPITSTPTPITSTPTPITSTPTPITSTPTPITSTPAPTPGNDGKVYVTAIFPPGQAAIPVDMYVAGNRYDTQITAVNAYGQQQATFIFWPPIGAEWGVSMVARLPDGLDPNQWKIEVTGGSLSMRIKQNDRLVVNLQILHK